MSRRITPESAARGERIAEMFKQGVTMEKIGRQFGITRERVRQILHRLGLKAEEGGIAKRLLLAGGPKVERKKEQARRKQEIKHGIAYDLLRALQDAGQTRAYTRHKSNSAKRGIAFDLTLAQWWAVWQASGHAHERGRGKGKYCMSRINDAGGYTLGNVHIQSCVQNSRDAVDVWKDAPPKAHRNVFLIYPGSKKPYMVRVCGKFLGYFATLEDAVAARDEYAAAAGVVVGRGGVGRGKGWTFVKRNKSRPYFMQGPGGARGSYATQAEAEAAYRAACDAYLSKTKEVA